MATESGISGTCGVREVGNVVGPPVLLLGVPARGVPADFDSGLSSWARLAEGGSLTVARGPRLGAFSDEAGPQPVSPVMSSILKNRGRDSLDWRKTAAPPVDTNVGWLCRAK